MRKAAFALGLILLSQAPALADESCQGSEQEQALCEARVKTAEARQAPQEERRQKLNSAGSALLDVFKRHAEKPCSEQLQGCDEAAAIVLEAGRLFEEGGYVAKAIAARRLIFGKDSHLERTPAAFDAAREIAALYERVGGFAFAAEWHERYGDMPGAAEAMEHLARAVRLRFMLGSLEAFSSAEKFAARFPDAHAIIDEHVIARARYHARAGRWAEAGTVLTDWNRFNRATPSLGVSALALRARIASHGGDAAAASAAVSSFRSAWQGLGEAERTAVDAAARADGAAALLSEAEKVGASSAEQLELARAAADLKPAPALLLRARALEGRALAAAGQLEQARAAYEACVGIAAEMDRADDAEGCERWLSEHDGKAAAPGLWSAPAMLSPESLLPPPWLSPYEDLVRE